MDQWCQRCRKPSEISIENLKESVWLNGPAWLQTDEDKWPKPWNEVHQEEDVQTVTNISTETKTEPLFEWNRYSNFNRIRNVIAYCLRFSSKHRGPIKAGEVLKTDKILLRIVQNESFPNVSKSITNSK